MFRFPDVPCSGPTDLAQHAFLADHNRALMPSTRSYNWDHHGIALLSGLMAVSI
jgi:hypothetical protein